MIQVIGVGFPNGWLLFPIVSYSSHSFFIQFSELYSILILFTIQLF